MPYGVLVQVQSRAPYKDVSMETYRREESPRFLGGFLYVCINFSFIRILRCDAAPATERLDGIRRDVKLSRRYRYMSN